MRTAFRRLLRLAIACLILMGLAPDVQASASRGPTEIPGSHVLFSLEPGLEADGHHSGAGHGGAEHCLSGPGCTSAAVLPEAADLLIGKAAPTLIRSDLSPPRWGTLPPLHPPNSASPG
jgi:hypothetical protein